MKKIRCAIYTRKSTEDGLEQEFNSLHAQREACAAYVASQKHEGWVLLADEYDDGGLSGGTLERPALGRLLDDVRQGRVDQIVVYKIDRLTRSLADFSKIVDILDAAEASFVSVTQSFNTATSMGRLTLNMLLSFAQFEREVTAERIRDKVAASKRKGLWMGGQVPLGYDADGRTLKVREDEATTIRGLYDLYERLGTVRAVTAEAARMGMRSRCRVKGDGTSSGGGMMGRGHIYQLLTNPLYAGRIRHRDRVFDGQHPALIDPDRWDAIQFQLQTDASRRRNRSAVTQKSRLCGKLFDETGDRLTPSHSRTRKGARLRYYISHRLVAQSGVAHRDAWRLPAEDLESKVAHLVETMLGDPTLAAKLTPEASSGEVARLSGAIKELADAAAHRATLDLVERVDLAPGELTLKIDVGIIAQRLDLERDAIDEDVLHRMFPFRLRKRGVETKIVLGTVPTGLDDTLIGNIAKAHAWLDRIKAGETFSDLAATETTSKRRIQHLIELAFLAPDLVRDILDGKQPTGFTSDWAVRHDLPSDWSAQRALIARL